MRKKLKTLDQIQRIIKTTGKGTFNHAMSKKAGEYVDVVPNTISAVYDYDCSDRWGYREEWFETKQDTLRFIKQHLK
jgi:hypothetical protein